MLLSMDSVTRVPSWLLLTDSGNVRPCRSTGGGNSLCDFLLSRIGYINHPIIFYLNWAPLSVVIVAGVPKRAIHPLKKASATVSARISTMGMASGQRVKRSMQVSKYLKPSAYGTGPTISMCTWSNLSVGSVNLPKTG